MNMGESEKACACSRWISWEGAAGLLLRWSIGLLFFFAGLNKFLGEGGVMGASGGIVSMFKDTYLPAILVAPYAYALPYLEVLLGVTLILGICSRMSLFAAGLLLLSLTLGMAVKGAHETVSSNLGYVFIDAMALWLASKSNPYAVDGLMKKSCGGAGK